MPRTSLPWVILATVAVAAALAWWTLTRSVGGPTSGELVHRDLAPFHEIEVGGNAAISLLQSDGESIDVDVPDRGARIVAEVKSGRLFIRSRDRRRWWSHLFGHRTYGRPHVIVRFRRLDVLALTGSVKIDAPKIKTQTLTIDASGGSALSIDEFRATTLHVSGSGALEAKLAGSVDEEIVSISGAGSYRAEHLLAKRARVSVSGVGNVLVAAEQTLRASISGAGMIEYVGDPIVTQHVSGIGRVRRRGPAPAQPTRASLRRPPSRFALLV